MLVVGYIAHKAAPGLRHQPRIHVNAVRASETAGRPRALTTQGSLVARATYRDVHVQAPDAEATTFHNQQKLSNCTMRDLAS